MDIGAQHIKLMRFLDFYGNWINTYKQFRNLNEQQKECKYNIGIQICFGL